MNYLEDFWLGILILVSVLGMSILFIKIYFTVQLKILKLELQLQLEKSRSGFYQYTASILQKKLSILNKN